MSAHTPGPWSVDGTDKGKIYIRPHGTGWLLAYIYKDSFTEKANPSWSVEANAHLIAAAPDLLAALKELQSPAYDNPAYPEETAATDARVEAAIAKAEGRS